MVDSDLRKFRIKIISLHIGTRHIEVDAYNENHALNLAKNYARRVWHPKDMIVIIDRSTDGKE